MQIFSQHYAQRDILVPLVISHAHLVPLAASVVEIVLCYVLSKTAIMSLGVHQDLRVYPNQLNQV